MFKKSVVADGSFIKQKGNILITGSTGVGKSYLASALEQQACQLGYKTLYFNTQKLFPKLKMMKADTYAKEVSKIEKYDPHLRSVFPFSTDSVLNTR